jgi:hypothetical protein
MRITAKERVSRSKLRQKLWAELKVWVQREKDMEVARSLSLPGVEEKLVFIRQEKAKLQREVNKADRGARKQRKWAKGGYA